MTWLVRRNPNRYGLRGILSPLSVTGPTLSLAETRETYSPRHAR
jgi:hypothetical protein